MRYLAIVLSSLLFCVSIYAADGIPQNVADCYRPTDGGWQIRITADPTAPRLKPGETIGVVGDDAGPHRRDFRGHGVDNRIVVGDDPRTHRRPLYPPTDRTLVWATEDLANRERIPFRPIILAANEPRFTIDLDSAGGLSGHLLLGLSLDNGPDKWLHQFRDLDVRYVEGRMEYDIRDASFPGVTIRIVALPLAESVGLVLKYRVEGLSQPGQLVWLFGGASGFTTNYNHSAPQYGFAPGQCDDNTIRWKDGRFALLRRGAAVLQGGGSSSDAYGIGDPQKVTDSVAATLLSARWCSAEKVGEGSMCVAVQAADLNNSPTEGWIIIGRGGNIESCLADPPAAERAARERTSLIAKRILIQTPDPYLNQAMPMLAFATDGIWGDAAMVHGAWSWRQAYLGWRICYGPLCYGWTDRVKRYIEQHAMLGLIRDGADKGAIASMLEAPNSCGYNMNEVFTDHVRQYFDYTGDVDLLRRAFPVLEGIAAWEGRRLQPTEQPLYESALDTWISDSHWYIRGQCTTASSYMLGLHRFLAEAAELLGNDPTPYRTKAEAIRKAMQQALWQPRRGIFAEYLDTTGAKLLHPEPELASIYHSAEFGAADPLQIYQMLHWVGHNLQYESTPAGGKAYWSSNWFPNAARSYTHSTHEMAYAEQLNLVVTNGCTGRTAELYSLLRGVLGGIYNGPAPGGLSCHMFADGRQRHNSEFADAISMWGRAVVEGLFGIRPKRHQGIVELSPQFPAEWPEASIKTPHFSYRWKREPGRILIEWESPVATSVELRQAAWACRIEGVTADGRPIAYHTEPGVELTWLLAKTPVAHRGIVAIAYAPAKIAEPKPLTWREGEAASLKLADYAATDAFDPQGILRDTSRQGDVLQGTVAGEPGSRLIFLKAGTESCPLWLPLGVQIEPKTPAPTRVWMPPTVKTGDLGLWTLVDIDCAFNAAVPEVLEQVGKASPLPPEPASRVNYSYWRMHVDGGYGPATVANFMLPHPVDDAAWRSKIGHDQIGWTHDGIPFRSPKEGKNIAVVTRAGGFPQRLECPVRASGKELYLMLSGMTYPMQSHVVNLCVTLGYADGAKQSVDLVNPFDIGDCWSTWCGRWHDTAANGFENLGGRFGPPGSSAAGDLTRPIAVDTEAHLVKIPLRPGVELRQITVEAVANDVIFGLMGASIL